MKSTTTARAIALAAAFCAVAVIAACEGEEKEGGRKQGGNDRAQVNENDVLQCGMSGTLLDNRTTGAYNVHVKVKNDCTAQLEDSLLPPADEAHLKVLDRQNRVVGGVDVPIQSQQTWRGVVPVPADARLVLECGRRGHFTVNHGCTWSYSYSP